MVRRSARSLMDDLHTNVKILLRESVDIWVAQNPYAVVDLADSYTSMGNPFLHEAETAWFKALVAEERAADNSTLDRAALLFARDHPTSVTQQYTSSGFRFLWAAENAFCTFLDRARARQTSRGRTNPSRPRKQPIPKAVRWAIWERDNFTCQHCGTRRYLAVDHIIPESRGGTLDSANLQTLCARCNSRKGARLPE